MIRSIVAGTVAAAMALAVGHLVAVFLAPAASPILAVGSALVDLAPQPLKAFAIETFGERDKEALLGGIGMAVLMLAAGVGLLARRHRAAAVGPFVAFGMVGALAAVVRPTAGPSWLVPSIAGGIAGAAVLVWLTSRAASSTDDRIDHSRRRFLVGATAAGVVAITAGGIAMLLGRARQAPVGDAGLPTPMDPAPALPDGVDLAMDGLSPFHTPNPDFYRVDTALDVPVVDPDAWTLRIHGLVDREVTLTLPELLELPIIERDVTLACVSNQVGGPYVGNARWLGVPLATVLELAGVRSGADQLVSRSIDGMTIGTPVAVVLDGRDAMLAVGMNGEPLPRDHGYPVRMLVPGLFGYVSATKWLVELELTTFDAYDPYWVQRGWAPEAPIRTMSRIDTPKPLSTVPAGPLAIAGVAWAPHRGIDRVEVRIDDGAWQDARLAPTDTLDTWRQWTLPWDATAGRHRLQVRATDGDSVIQTETRREPFPDGATGWHSVVMTVNDPS